MQSILCSTHAEMVLATKTQFNTALEMPEQVLGIHAVFLHCESVGFYSYVRLLLIFSLPALHRSFNCMRSVTAVLIGLGLLYFFLQTKWSHCAEKLLRQ